MRKVALENAFQPGDNDPGQVYPDASIREISIGADERTVTFLVEHGEAVAPGVWQKGGGATSVSLSLPITSVPGLAAELRDVYRLLLEKAQDLGHIKPGTIVSDE